MKTKNVVAVAIGCLLGGSIFWLTTGKISMVGIPAGIGILLAHFTFKYCIARRY